MSGETGIRRAKGSRLNAMLAQKRNTVRLSSLISYSTPDIMAVSLLPRKTINDVMHALHNRVARPQEKTIEALNLALRWLDAESEYRTFYNWRGQLKQRGITQYAFARRLGIPQDVARELWAGHKRWTAEWRQKLASLLGIKTPVSTYQRDCTSKVRSK